VTRTVTRVVHFGEARKHQGSGRHRNLATSKAFELNLSWQCFVLENLVSPSPPAYSRSPSEGGRVRLARYRTSLLVRHRSVLLFQCTMLLLYACG